MTRATRSDDWPSFITGSWGRTHRLIPAAYAHTTEPFVAKLSADPDDIAALVDLAAATNNRLAAQLDRGLVAIGADELVFHIEFAQIVNAAFTYPGQGARFNDRTRGAWYCAVDVDTSLAEVIHHRRIHLAEIDRWVDRIDYQDYTCSVSGPWFANLTDGDTRGTPLLDPDSYIAGQVLASRLVADDRAGVVYPSVRHDGGVCIACFRPALLPPIGVGRRYRLEWTGTPDPTVTALPASDW